MIYIKRFIDKVSLMESKQNKDLVMPMIDARGLRDELAKILVDQYDARKEQKDAVIQVEGKGGSFT
jgi:hypothetical protein